MKFLENDCQISVREHAKFQNYIVVSETDAFKETYRGAILCIFLRAHDFFSPEFGLPTINHVPTLLTNTEKFDKYALEVNN